MTGRGEVAALRSMGYRRATMQSTAASASGQYTAFEINQARGERKAFALRDLADGVSAVRLYMTLGWLDVKLRYRGSVLGPFWLTLSTIIWVLSMGLLYSQLFQMDTHRYLPYLALSLVLWNAIGAVIGDACTCFTSAEGTIRSLRLPYTIYASRATVKNLLIMLHNLPVVIGVFAWYGTWPGAEALACLPGFAVWLVDSMAACLLLGAFCARFRDVGPIVGSVMQIAFFLTPVIWQPELIGANAQYLLFNPFWPLLAIVQLPLLGHLPGYDLWGMALLWSGLLCGATAWLFVRARGRLAFWV